MAKLTFTVDDAKAQRMLDGFCDFHGYAPTLVDPMTGESTPNPESKTEFLRRHVKDYIMGAVKASEGRAAENAARQIAENAVVQDIVIT